MSQRVLQCKFPEKRGLMKLLRQHMQYTVVAAIAAFTVSVSGCSGVNPATSNQSGASESGSDNSVVGQTVDLGRGGESVVIGLTYVPNVQFAPVYVAGADEIFRAAGIGASIRHHGADEGLFTALVAGEENITVASGDEVLQARASGLDLVSIGAYYHEYPVVILALESSGISSVKDLKGKEVGVPGEFGSNWFGLLAALDSAGMTVDDIEVVSIGYTQAATLAAKQVDAVVGFINSDAVQLSQMAVATNIIELSDQPVPLVGATIVTTREWADSHPQLAKAVVGAITAGIDRVTLNPQHAIEVTQHWDKGLEDPQVRATAAQMLEATIPLWEGPGGVITAHQDLDTWNAMAPFLSEVLEVNIVDFDVSQAVTNEYAGK